MRRYGDESNNDTTGHASDDEPDDRDQPIVDRPVLDSFHSLFEGPGSLTRAIP
jgi:hypothetical protein